MSEKRFEVDVDHLLLVWDTEKNKRLEVEDIVDLLNSLSEENEQLKKYLKIHNESELSSIEYNLKLYEENRQLMQKNKELFKDLLESQFSNQKYAETCYKWLNELWEDNERLHYLKVLANAFIVEKGLEVEFVRWCKEDE